MNTRNLITLAVLMCASTAIGADRHVPRDYHGIQAAIDAAVQGDTIIVAAGTYLERIRLKTRIHLRSAGDDTRGKLGLQRAEKTIIQGPAQKETAGDADPHPVVAMAEGAIIDGFTVTASDEYDDKTWQHHYDTQGNEQKHEHIGEFGTPGIAVRGVNCDVINNIVHHVGSTGIAIAGDDGKRTSPRITANICYRNMGGGIGSMKGSTAIIDGNTCFENFHAGIGHNQANPYVINNVCFNNVRAGIGISEGACPVVRHNKCYKNRRAGIGTRTGKETQPVIEHNECYENAMAGIGTDEDAQPIIRNNQCHHNQLAGIGSQHGAAPWILENRSHDNGAAGIGAREGARPVIIGNHSSRNATAGIGLETQAESVVMRNTCVDNKLVALGMPNGGSALIADNTFDRKGGLPPLLAIRGGAKATLFNNAIKGGGVAGVLVQGDVTLLHNTFDGRQHNQPNRAVWGWKDSTIRMMDNTTMDYKQAISATGCAVTVIANDVRSFTGVAIQIGQSTRPPRVIDNVGTSENAKAIIAKTDPGIMEANQLSGNRPN